MTQTKSTCPYSLTSPPDTYLKPYLIVPHKYLNTFLASFIRSINTISLRSPWLGAPYDTKENSPVTIMDVPSSTVDPSVTEAYPLFCHDPLIEGIFLLDSFHL